MWFPPSELVRKKQIMPNILYATPTWVWRIHNTWPHGKATYRLRKKSNLCFLCPQRIHSLRTCSSLYCFCSYRVFFCIFLALFLQTRWQIASCFRIWLRWVMLEYLSKWDDALTDGFFFGNPWNLEDSNTSFGKKSGWLPQIMFRRWPSGSRDSHVEGDHRLKAIASAFNFNLYSCSDLYNDMFWRTWTIALLLVGNLALHSRAWI